jgi:hypothetical protein
MGLTHFFSSPRPCFSQSRHERSRDFTVSFISERPSCAGLRVDQSGSEVEGLNGFAGYGFIQRYLASFLPQNSWLPPLDTERSARGKRNKCRRPSAASYGGFPLARSGVSDLGMVHDLLSVVVFSFGFRLEFVDAWLAHCFVCWLLLCAGCLAICCVCIKLFGS